MIRFVKCPNPECGHDFEYSLDSPNVPLFCTECKYPVFTSCWNCLHPFTFRPGTNCCFCSCDLIDGRTFLLSAWQTRVPSEILSSVCDPQQISHLQYLHQAIPLFRQENEAVFEFLRERKLDSLALRLERVLSMKPSLKLVWSND